MLAGSRVSCIGVIMATVPVLSSRGLDHDSVFKSGELFPARPRTFVQVGSPARVLEARLSFFTKLKVIICFKLLEH